MLLGRIRQFPLLRPLLLAALLLGELLFLTLRFDTQPLRASPGWWAWPMSHARVVPELAIAIATGTLVVGGTRLLHSLNSLSLSERAVSGRSIRTLCFLAHIGLFACFVALTGSICASPDPLARTPAFAWLVVALVVLLSWGGALLTPAEWRWLLHRNATALIAGVISGCIAWAAAIWTAEQWGALGNITIHLVADCLRCAGFATVTDADQRIVGTPAFQVAVSTACCGYEGIGLFWVFYSLHLIYSRRRLRFPAALLLFPLGTLALLIANVLRIALLIAIGNAGFTDLAIGGFHSQAGWIAFNVVALGIVALTSHVSYFRRTLEPAQEKTECPAVSVGAFLNPFLIIVAVGMLARALTPFPEALYPLRVIGAALILLVYRKQYQRLRWTVSAEALAAGIAGALVWIALVRPAPGDIEPSPGPSWPFFPAASALWLIFRVIGSTVTVPLAEELAFRGYLPGRLSQLSDQSRNTRDRRFPWIGVALSSWLFGLMHGNWIAGTLAGAFYAIVFLRRRSLGDAVAAHATSNALLAAYASTTGQWWLWS